MLQDIPRKEILYVDIVPCNKRDIITTVTRISAINMPNVIATIVITSLCHYYYYHYYHSHNVYTPKGKNIVVCGRMYLDTYRGRRNDRDRPYVRRRWEKKKEGNIEAWIHARVHARRNEAHQHWPGDRQSGRRKYGGDGVMMMVVVMVEDTFV